MPLKDDVERLQKSKGMDIRLDDYETGCLTNLRFADDVLLFSVFAGAAPKNNERLQAVYWKCRIKNPPGQDAQILSNQCANRRKDVEINDI